MKTVRWMLLLGLLTTVAIMGLGWSPQVQAKDRTEILIGTNLPMTGILAGVGREQRWAYEQAVNDLNAKGGIHVKEFGKKLKVKLIVADDESNPGKAGKAVERLIKVDKVDMLLGGFAAPFGVIPGCITAEKYHKYYHTSICLVPPWLEKKFKWSTLFFFDLEQACAVPFQIWETFPEGQRPSTVLGNRQSTECHSVGMNSEPSRNSISPEVQVISTPPHLNPLPPRGERKIGKD